MNCNAHRREHALHPLVKTLILATVALTLSACGSLGYRKANSVDYAAISNNLVDVLSQYTRLNPRLATVQVSPPDNLFERQVQQEMTDRGYKLEKLSEQQVATAVNGVKTQIQSPAEQLDGDASPMYILTIGQVSVERRYDTTDNKTQPASEVVIRGGEERTVTLNDAELFGTTGGMISTVAFKPVAEQQVAQVAQTAQTTIVQADVFEPTASSRRIEAMVQRQVPMKWNMYDTLQSNYVSLFTDYEDVERNILVFPNDSLRLGETNKQIIEQYVEKMNPETDVLSVIGCSHGATEIGNGNSLLALGRANRVKEAFLFSGVQHEHVMDEGCWAPKTFDEVMPRRGVVLTLKRRKNS